MSSPPAEKSELLAKLDVFLIGPFIIWTGLDEKRLPGWARAGLVLVGAGTVAHNAQTFFKGREADRQKEAQALKADVEAAEKAAGVVGSAKAPGDLRESRSRMAARHDR